MKKAYIFTITVEVPEDLEKPNHKARHCLSVMEDIIARVGFDLYDSNLEQEVL